MSIASTFVASSKVTLFVRAFFHSVSIVIAVVTKSGEFSRALLEASFSFQLTTVR